jgi:hypothetical protein
MDDKAAWPSDCKDCGAPYPHCDCTYLAIDSWESQDALETAWEIIDEG